MVLEEEYVMLFINAKAKNKYIKDYDENNKESY